ncbi:hypothetical protein [Ectobacillus funiculus]|nr:hypothetical protein [Ectobacillus funiculus]
MESVPVHRHDFQEFVLITDFPNGKAHSFSGGMKVRSNKGVSLGTSIV